MKKEMYKLLSEHFECTINNMYKDVHTMTDNNLLSGGELRGHSCKIQEQTMHDLLYNICLINNIPTEKITIVKGDVKGNGLTISNEGGYVNIGVDWHVYLYGELVLVNECKSYLDAAFMSRAYTYIRSIKENTEYANVKSLITCMEKSLNCNTLGFYMHDDVIDHCSFLMPGTRRSTQPLYLREYWKSVNKEAVCNLITFIDTTIKEYVDGARKKCCV